MPRGGYLKNVSEKKKRGLLKKKKEVKHNTQHDTTTIMLLCRKKIFKVTSSIGLFPPNVNKNNLFLFSAVQRTAF